MEKLLSLFKLSGKLVWIWICFREIPLCLAASTITQTSIHTKSRYMKCISTAAQPRQKVLWFAARSHTPSISVPVPLHCIIMQLHCLHCAQRESCNIQWNEINCFKWSFPALIEWFNKLTMHYSSSSTPQRNLALRAQCFMGDGQLIAGKSNTRKGKQSLLWTEKDDLFLLRLRYISILCYIKIIAA